MSVSDNGLLLYKATRFVVLMKLRAGLLKGLHMGHPGVLSMVLRAKDSFWWPGLTSDIEQVRAYAITATAMHPARQKSHHVGLL